MSRRAIRALIAASVFSTLALIRVYFATAERALVEYGGADGKLGGEFTLVGVDGPVSLADYRGRVVVLYFGFLNCEEVCLNSMRVLQQAITRLDADHEDQVHGVLISVDPQRDTPQDLQNFAARFHDNIVGVTGSQAEIDAVALDYGAFFEITVEDRNDPGYFFRHSSRYYVIGPDGELIDAMRHSTTANEIVARVEQVLAAKLAAEDATNKETVS